MTMTRKSFFLLVSLIVASMMFCPTSDAKAFRIGWGFWGGWIPHHTYVESQDIHIGDTLEFIYDHDYDNLLQVTRENYQVCNRENPLVLFTPSTGDGTAVFQVTEYGHFYFISGIPSQCEGNMKIHIHVPNPYNYAPVQSPSKDVYGPSTAPAPSSSFTSTAPAPSSSSPFYN